jgi:hypothetical protein
MIVKSVTIVLIIFIDCLVSRGGVKSCFYKGKECGGLPMWEGLPSPDMRIKIPEKCSKARD